MFKKLFLLILASLSSLSMKSANAALVEEKEKVNSELIVGLTEKEFDYALLGMNRVQIGKVIDYVKRITAAQIYVEECDGSADSKARCSLKIAFYNAFLVNDLKRKAIEIVENNMKLESSLEEIFAQRKAAVALFAYLEEKQKEMLEKKQQKLNAMLQMKKTKQNELLNVDSKQVQNNNLLTAKL
jgi:hypothetical protein